MGTRVPRKTGVPPSISGFLTITFTIWLYHEARIPPGSFDEPFVAWWRWNDYLNCWCGTAGDPPSNSRMGIVGRCRVFLCRVLAKNRPRGLHPPAADARACRQVRFRSAFSQVWVQNPDRHRKFANVFDYSRQRVRRVPVLLDCA